MTDEQPEEVAEDVAAGETVGGEEPNDVEGLRTRLEEEKQRAGKHYESWQRSAADYQNYKRRMEEERREVARLATASLIINLLPLIDDIDRALRSVDPKIAGLTWIDGIWMIYRKFEAVLQNSGVTEIEADAQQFDPTVHEAISEAPGEAGKVISVVQKGYKLGDRVIRPAMVVVGKSDGAAASEDAAEGDETEEKETS